MLVTCYYDIYNKPERFMEYLYLFYDLGISGIPMVIFTDPSLVYKFRIFPYNVKVIGIPLNEFEFSSLFLIVKPNLKASDIDISFFAGSFSMLLIVADCFSLLIF